MKSMRLREATGEDLTALAAIMRALPEWFTAEAVEEFSATAKGWHGLVAVEDDEVRVGFLLWQRQQEVCEIKWIAVARDRQRRGIGRTLIARLVELAQATGVARLEVATVAATVEYEPYARTRAFYQACGFKLESVEPHGWPDGTDKAVYVLDMQRGQETRG